MCSLCPVIFMLRYMITNPADEQPQWFRSLSKIIIIVGKIGEVLGKSKSTVGRAAVYKSSIPNSMILLEIVVDLYRLQKRKQSTPLEKIGLAKFNPRAFLHSHCPAAREDFITHAVCRLFARPSCMNLAQKNKNTTLFFGGNEAPRGQATQSACWPSPAPDG